VIAGATLPGQRSVIARLDGIARAADDAALGTPATLVVGDVVTAIPTHALLEATVGFQFG